MSRDIVIPLKLIDPKEKKSNGELSYSELVNSFLALANNHWKTIEIDDISAALREAAARYNAFEANIKSVDLKADRENAIEWFTQSFNETLTKNLDDYIQNQSK